MCCLRRVGSQREAAVAMFDDHGSGVSRLSGVVREPL